MSKAKTIVQQHGNRVEGPHLVGSTYQCSKEGGVEYGWQFNRPGCEDTLFDLVLGTYTDKADADEAERAWKTTRWAVRALVAAAGPGVRGSA